MIPLHATPASRPGPAGRRAFTLIEILITMGLLSFIVLGLMAMFNQTQRLFRGGLTQADILESGRNVMDLLAREIEQTTPSYRSNEWSFFNGIWSTSLQGLPGSVRLRTNYVGYLFFVTGQNQDWTGTGYYVDDVLTGGNGTLFRFSTNRAAAGTMSLSSAYATALQAARTSPVGTAGWNRIADGVVHFQVRAFAPNGFPVVGHDLTIPPTLTVTNAYYRTNAVFDGYSYVRNAAVNRSAVCPDDIATCYYYSNAVPAFVEIEVGILEPQILERFKGIGIANQAARLNYLSNHVAQVHLFRQRIPIRNVDPTAYP
jgi:hypothetical protein